MGILDPLKGFLRLPNSGADGAHPGKLPGRFFLLEFEREDRAFILHVDDADKSTYDLGSEEDIPQIRLAFKLRGYDARLIDNWIDMAREFGAAQYIPTAAPALPDRVIQILPRDLNYAALTFPDPDQDGTYQHL